MTVSGLSHLVTKIVKKAGVVRTHIGPHTFRHTFAVEFLRLGGNQFTLQQRMGHTCMEMTKRYVTYAQADINRQARMFSPADALMKPK
jgi:integrase